MEPEPTNRLADGVLVEAQVRARLLGAPILRLDAEVVLAPARADPVGPTEQLAAPTASDPRALPSPPSGSGSGSGSDSRSRAGPAAGSAPASASAPGSALAEAVSLVEQSARRLRGIDQGRSGRR